MTVSINVQAYSQIRAVRTDSNADPSDQTTSYTSQSSTDTYTGSTTVPVTKSAKFTVTLDPTTHTLDLTAIPNDTGGTFDGTGLKVQFLRFKATATNANKIVISNAASNPYRIDATTTAWSINLVAGQVVALELNDAADDVGGTHLGILFTGTGVQTIDCHIILG